jgi:thioredoxin reductase (NADPH)
MRVMKPGIDGEPDSNLSGRRREESIVDCVVVGGGPAGLSAAVNMGRMRRSVVIVDDRDGRSLWGQTNRNYLGFPEGIPAAEIRLAGREQAARYGTRFIHAHVRAAVRRNGAAGSAHGHFELELEPCPEPGEAPAAGRPGNVVRDVNLGRSLGERRVAESTLIRARTLIVATGVRDAFPSFDGWEECVGRSLFWCINCDGYETIGHKVAVVGPDEEAAQTALQLLDFTADVALVAGTDRGFGIPASRLADLAGEGIATYPQRVAEYRNAAGHIKGLILGDAAQTRLDVDMVFQYHRPVARAEIAAMLEVQLDEIGQIVVDSSQQTNVPGFYAAGDVTHPHNHQISAAVHEGNEAACAANYFLYRPVQKANGREEV